VVWITLLLAGFFNVLNLALTNYGFEKVKVVVAGNLLMLEMVFALVYGWLLFQEIPTGREILGGLCIIVSIFAINRIEGE
jgi:drug/metabolite transporter (DMT)-like permease